jgi:hypothetical protein
VVIRNSVWPAQKEEIGVSLRSFAAVSLRMRFETIAGRRRVDSQIQVFTVTSRRLMQQYQRFTLTNLTFENAPLPSLMPNHRSGVFNRLERRKDLRPRVEAAKGIAQDSIL